MKKFLTSSILALGLLATPLAAQDVPFGTDEDADYAALIWDVMVSARLAGEGSVITRPTDGGVEQHGRMLETFYSSGTIDGHTGDLIVKRNYGPEGVTSDQILQDPSKHLGAITVMFRREAGFDEDNKNWFWVMFLPDGTVGKNPAGMRMAGRVAKGADIGCIACHSAEEDRVYTTDHFN